MFKIVLLVSFLLSIFATKFTIKWLERIGEVSADLHKTEKKKIARLGGISIAVSFAAGVFLIFLLEKKIEYIAVLAAFLISAGIGLLDDFFRLKPFQKLVLAGLGAVPLFFISEFNFAAVLFLIIAVSVASNWTNMLAGFNGLEAGLGFIAVVFLALNVDGIAQNVLLVYAVVLLGFLIFNKYPAKIFPGNVGTMPIGMILVSAVVLGAPILKLSVLIIPYFVDAVLKFLSAGIMESSKFEHSTIKNGFLVPQKNYLSLVTVIMKIKPLKEWELVAVILLIEVVLGAVTLVV